MRVWEGKFLINWKFTVWKGEKRKKKKKKPANIIEVEKKKVGKHRPLNKLISNPCNIQEILTYIIESF